MAFVSYCKQPFSPNLEDASKVAIVDLVASWCVNYVEVARSHHRRLTSLHISSNEGYEVDLVESKMMVLFLNWKVSWP